MRKLFYISIMMLTFNTSFADSEGEHLKVLNDFIEDCHKKGGVIVKGTGNTLNCKTVKKAT